MKNGKLFLALLVLGSVWGLTIPLSKIVVSTGYSPLGVVFWQSLFSVIILAVICLVRREKIIFSRRLLWHFVIMGLVGSLIPGFTFYVAATQLPGGFLAIIIATAPMFSLLIALSLRIEKFAALRMMGVILGGAAVVLLIAPDATLPVWTLIPFVLIALIGPLSYAIEAIYLAVKAPKDVNPVVTLLGASIVATVVSGPIAWSTGHWADIVHPWTTVEWALLFMATVSVFAYVGYITLVNIAGAVFAIQVAYVVTIAGVILSALILSENYTPWVWLALAMMLAGLALVQPSDTAPKPAK